MAAITYGRIPATIVASAKPTKGFWARWFDRFVEARMRQVERELRIHGRYAPEDFKSYQAVTRDAK